MPLSHRPVNCEAAVVSIAKALDSNTSEVYRLSSRVISSQYVADCAVTGGLSLLIGSACFNLRLCTQLFGT